MSHSRLWMRRCHEEEAILYCTSSQSKDFLEYQDVPKNWSLFRKVTELMEAHDYEQLAFQVVRCHVTQSPDVLQSLSLLQGGIMVAGGSAVVVALQVATNPWLKNCCLFVYVH